ncbi:MAG: hypothetical protein EWM72_02239 [Nitrospira sp.]|nr:MAG: hypothetical protein EWM72_02239 [Nitrospira sp.]
MRGPWCMALCFFILTWALEVKGEEVNVRGYLHVSHESLRAILPQDTHLLLDPASIEQFLDVLDGSPPDWATVYGHGHDDPGHDDRLFALNRERDAKREGKLALSWLITFVWLGELSSYNPDAGGFPVALGPKFTSTRWGIVRFKPEEVPGNLVVVVDALQREQLQRKIEQRRHLDIEVVMTGRLIPEESLVYDFSHDEEGLGLIMPFVRVEQVDFILPQ